MFVMLRKRKAKKLISWRNITQTKLKVNSNSDAVNKTTNFVDIYQVIGWGDITHAGNGA